ncbi:hypothetical protein LCGC14_0443450 [marine sediment metagenome]|uniref:Uncharacterized protein n=1 Tax=marine sediment metagenome TaxID=412755 RepID=A0A0F9SQH1_9ZZZZ
MEIFAGLLVLAIPIGIWLLFGYWGSYITRNKGRGGGAGWALGLLGILIAATLSDNRGDT